LKYFTKRYYKLKRDMFIELPLSKRIPSYLNDIADGSPFFITQGVGYD